MSKAGYVFLGATALLAVTSCSGSRSDVGPGAEDMKTAATSCTATQYEAQIALICKAQFPPAPAPRTTGAACTGDPQCDSRLCLMPFGSGDAYCSLPCPNGNECPVGYGCQDSGTRGPVCYRTVCGYVGSDQAGCVTVLKQEAGRACSSGCSMELSSWMTCLGQAGFICGPADADAKCGTERGFLESCCPGCDRDL